MKKLFGILLAVMLAVTAMSCAFAESETVPQTEAGKKFDTNWAAPGYNMQVFYEEEGYRVRIDEPDVMNDSGTEWEYSCFYNAEKDALESVSSSKRTYTYDADRTQVSGLPEYDDVDEEGQVTVFAIGADGKLTWQDARGNAGEGLVFENIGRFEGVYRNEAEEVEVKIVWLGLSEDEMWYDVFIKRGNDESYVDFGMRGFYNPETGKLEAMGTAMTFTKNAEGAYDVTEDTESYDAFFSFNENNNLVYETANGIELEYDVTADVHSN